MKSILVIAIACAVAIALAVTGANAYSSYATSTGKPCGYCHIATGGGGPLTPAGQYFRDNGTLPPATPSAPTGLSATASSETQINLKWTDTSSDETGFKIERASVSSGPFTVIATLGAGVITYSNTGLTASTTYYYRVCSFNTAGNSGYSNTTSATTSAPAPVLPAAPTGLSVTAVSTSELKLTWTDASTNETGFIVEKASSATGPFTVVTTLGAGTIAYSDTGLTEATTYFYRVCALNAAGSSDYSDTASATTAASTPTTPAAPTGLSAVAASGTQINLKWADASSNETGFKVERASSSTGPFTLIATLGAGVTTYSNTGLAGSSTYYYRVCAYNDAGDSEYSNTASATTSTRPTLKPAAPRDLTATAVSSRRIRLEWTDASSNERGFKVERATSEAGPFKVVRELEAGKTHFTDRGLDASTTYFYRVFAFNRYGNSTYSEIASATTNESNDDDDRDGRRDRDDDDHNGDGDRDRD